MEANWIYSGDCREALSEMPDGWIQCIVTSPPYWGLRDYDLEPVVWGGIIPGCEHRWGNEALPRRSRSVADIKDPGSKEATKSDSAYNASGGKFCVVCGAWLGTLGLEPTPELYVEHIVEVFREVKRVLRDDGTCWLNIGDSYWGGKGRSGYELPHEAEDRRAKGETIQHGYQVPGYMRMRPADGKHLVIKPKDLVMIPFRVALALQRDGWWVRSDIVWAKGNPMPESVTDRPTKSHEYVFLLVKSKKYYYDADAIREPHTWIESKPRPSGMERQAQKYRDKIKYGGAGTGFAGHSGSLKADGSSLNHPLGRNKRSVWSINSQPYPEAHFATFPEKLVESCILAGSSPESIVLDPFAGSGTTCAVAKRLGRSWIGIEANPDYVKLAEKRVAEAVYEPLLPGMAG